MALRKIYLAVDCDNDQERDMVQEMANEISNMRVLKGRSILNMLPIFQRNQSELIELFQMVSKGGVKSLLSIQGGLLIKKLSSKNK